MSIPLGPTPTSGPPWLLSRPTLLAEGLSDNVIRRALAVGTLVSVLPGLYAPAGTLAPPEPAAVLCSIAAAVLPRLAAGSVVSHLSAAALHGLPVPAGGHAVVHVTRPPPSTSRRGRVVWLHRGLLDPDEVVVVDGLPVTSPARTVVDCARTMEPPDAAALAQDAVGTGLVTGAQLVLQVRRRPRVPGIRAAGALLADAIRPP